jgi:hypothetical protein
MYQTDRQAGAEAIVKILREVPAETRIVAQFCVVCDEFFPDDKSESGEHNESCPFRLADEFIAKYGTHPPEEPKAR